MVHCLYKEELRNKNWVYMQMPNHDEYVGEVFEGKAHGMGTYVYRGGKKDACYPVYFGNFRAGERHGSGCLHYS